MSQKNFLNSKRGFSLLEVLIALTLFAFLAVGVLSMTSMGIKSNSYARQHTKAVQLAESNMEMMRRVDYNDVLPCFDGISHSKTSTNGVTVHPVEDYGSIPQYRDFRRVSRVIFAPDISTLQVKVTWRSLGVDRTQGEFYYPIALESQRVSQ